MANAKKCDRCGSYYDKNTKHRTTGRVIGGMISGIQTETRLGEKDCSYDLCDDCITDLFEFLDGKESKD